MFGIQPKVNVPSVRPRKQRLSKAEQLNEYRARILSSIGKLSDKDTTKQGVSELISFVDQVETENIPLLLVCNILFCFCHYLLLILLYF